MFWTGIDMITLTVYKYYTSWSVGNALEDVRLERCHWDVAVGMQIWEDAGWNSSWLANRLVWAELERRGRMERWQQRGCEEFTLPTAMRVSVGHASFICYLLSYNSWKNRLCNLFMFPMPSFHVTINSLSKFIIYSLCPWRVCRQLSKQLENHTSLHQHVRVGVWRI